MRKFKKKRRMQRINALLDGIAGGMGGATIGMIVWLLCAFFEVKPKCIALSYVLLYCPAWMAVVGFVFVFSQDIWLFRKEW